MKGMPEPILQGLLAAVITFSVLAFPLSFVEAPLFDLRQKWSLRPSVDDRIALITLDDQTINQLNELSPLPVSYHLKAVKELERHGVRGVGYAIDFNSVQRIDADGFQSQTIQEFYRATVALNAGGTPFLLGTPFDASGEVSAPFPLSQIPQSIALIHRDGVTFGKDKVTRRALLSLYERPAYEMSLVSRIFANETILNPPGTYRSSEADAQYFLFRHHQNDGVFFDPNYETFAYPRFSFVDLIEGRIPEGTLRDKIVLVGTFIRDNPADFTLISSLSDSSPVPKILIQANVLDSILNQQGVAEVSQATLATLCFILSLIISFASFKIRPTRLILLTVLLLSGTFLVSLLAFQPIRIIGNTWIPLGAPLLSLAISFYLMIPIRLYSEHRKRFALEEEKSSLLAVEEMKTNFIQLVTHDLKTPVARIQGLTEQLKRSLSERMTAKDRELLDHLLSANHSLNHFIGSLLELTKLDNQGIRVQLQSKDINPLLDQVIQKHRFSAQAKNIELHATYEPLFPIRIDPDLISKVLSNLIDNAIKYSPEGTRVEVATSETNTHVEIRISDQGVGIPESEIQNLFRRFHRIRNDAAYSIKGTGLGLYLSRYFIEAHKGAISIESAPGKGTTFIVRLPVDLKETDLNTLPLPTQKEMPYA